MLGVALGRSGVDGRGVREEGGVEGVNGHSDPCRESCCSDSGCNIFITCSSLSAGEPGGEGCATGNVGCATGGLGAAGTGGTAGGLGAAGAGLF